MMSANLTDVSTHFAFGENWGHFLGYINDDSIARAEAGLLELIPAERLYGASFLDIGCGSGLSSLAALRLGVNRLVAVDIDPQSVEATRKLLSSRAPGAGFTVAERSIFETGSDLGQFDIVYSWGVLHHTGAMWEAIGQAGKLVRPGGLLVIAIYAKTRSCSAWRTIKHYYSAAPKERQKLMRGLYKALFFSKLVLTGQSPKQYVAGYAARGMNFDVDLHDWIGGYPYESASADEIVGFLRPRGFRAAQVPETPLTPGIFGSGCAEYVFERETLDTISEHRRTSGDDVGG